MIILFKYCADVKNYDSFKDFGYIYIIIIIITIIVIIIIGFLFLSFSFFDTNRLGLAIPIRDRQSTSWVRQ